jgi:hypothetical protein
MLSRHVSFSDAVQVRVTFPSPLVASKFVGIPGGLVAEPMVKTKTELRINIATVEIAAMPILIFLSK